MTAARTTPALRQFELFKGFIFLPLHGCSPNEDNGHPGERQQKTRRARGQAEYRDRELYSLGASPSQQNASKFQRTGSTKHVWPDSSGYCPSPCVPLDFIARLAALVPRPKLNLTRFHGVFAPNFRYRKRIVPHRSRGKADSDQPTAPMTWMQRLQRVFAMPQGTLS